MKIFNRIISLLMVLLMLITSVPYVNVSAASDGEESCTLTVENTYEDSFIASNSAAGGISFFGDTEFNGCYGNQLTGVAKELYDSMVDYYATNKNTGEYAHTFATPFTFNAEIQGSSIVMNDELEEISLTINYVMQVAMDAFLYDHPEVFWLRIVSSSYSISVSGNSVDGYVGTISNITITPTEIYSGASSKISQYDEAVHSALSAITVTESRYDTLKNVHDYICNNAYYNLIDDYCVHSSEAFFIGDGGVVCEGYAKAFKVLCDELEIPCVLVSGDAGGAHMWNYVQMDDNKWYLVDATWDDQQSKIYDTYFLANANTVGFNDVVISEERTEKTDFSGTGYFSFAYPVLSTTAYTVHTHEWESEYMVDVEATCTEKGSKSIHCKNCDETKSVTEIDATNHINKTEHTQQDATCTENGFTAGEYCPDCEDWIEGHEVLAAGHSDEDNDSVCDVCDEYTSKVVETGYCGETVTYTYNNETEEVVISGSGAMFDYNSTDASPFHNSSIKTIVIENGVTTIGKYAFFFAVGLKDVIIPKSVVTIGAYAFSMCGNLESVDISDGVTTIGDFAFAWCINLNSIIIPGSVISIGENVFQKCEKLESINVDSNNKIYSSDDAGALFDKNKTELIKYPLGNTNSSYIVPDGVTAIGCYAFNNCENLESITVAESVENINAGCFIGCEKLAGIIVGDDSKYYSCDSAGVLFDKEKKHLIQYPIGNDSESYTIPDGVTDIDSYSFFGCHNLKKVTILNNDCNFELDCGLDNSYIIQGYKGSTAETFADEIGATFVDVETHSHEYQMVENKKATCSKGGEILERCDCGEEKLTTTEKLPHTEVRISGRAATCTKTGLTEGEKCADCGTVTVAQTTIAKKPHTNKTTITKATLSKNGKTETKCSSCGYVSKTVAIARPKTIKLSTTEYTYNGKVRTPSVTVKDSNGKTLKKNTDYTVKYESGRKVPGKYTVTITFKGNYTGTKKLYFTIAPKVTSKITATQTTSTITLKWNKVTGADCYRVYKYNSKTKKYEKLKDVTGTSLKISKLKASTAYKYKVRAYTKDDGTIWGGYSSVFETATKPKTPTLKVSSTSKGKATFSWTNVSGESGYQVYYSTKKDSGFKKVKSYKTNVVKGSKSKLKSGKKYYFKVRAYKKTASGTVYSSWSSVKSIKIK